MHPEDHLLERKVLAVLWTEFGKSVINYLILKVSKTSAVDIIKLWAVPWNIPVAMFIFALLQPLPGIQSVGAKREKQRAFFDFFRALFFTFRSN